MLSGARGRAGVLSAARGALHVSVTHPCTSGNGGCHVVLQTGTVSRGPGIGGPRGLGCGSVPKPGRGAGTGCVAMVAGEKTAPNMSASQLENLKANLQMVPCGHMWSFPTMPDPPPSVRFRLTLALDRPGLRRQITSGSREASQGAAQTSGPSFWGSASLPLPTFCRGQWHVHPRACTLSYSLGAVLRPLLTHSELLSAVRLTRTSMAP